MFKLTCCRKEQGAICYLIKPDKSQFNNVCVCHQIAVYLPQCCVCDFPKLIMYYYDRNKQLLGNMKISIKRAAKVLDKMQIIKTLNMKENKVFVHKSSWYLNYNNWGTIKPCYSNFHNIKLGQLASWYEDLR